MTDSQPRRMRTVEREEALRLLGSVPYGRIVFTERALPAVRTVTHIVDGGDVVVRTHAGVVGQVVAYEADSVGEGPRLEWSVVVVGMAEEARAEEVDRYERLLPPMVDGPASRVVRIRPELVTAAEDLPATA
jgi:hypothetical protein